MYDSNLLNTKKFTYLPSFISKEEVNFTLAPEFLSEQILHHKTFLSKPPFIKIKESDEYIEKATTVMNHPDHKLLCVSVKQKIENMLGLELFPAYYVNHYYGIGSILGAGAGKRSREYTLCLQISSNLETDWPLLLVNESEETFPILLNPGDAVLYKGLELAAYTSPLPSRHNVEGTTGLFNDDTYCHRMFFNFVDADGYHLEYAYVG